MLKKLPIGIQTFSNIIEENYLYIDKTQDVLEVVEERHILKVVSNSNT